MATLPKVLISRADYQIGGAVALGLRTQEAKRDGRERTGPGEWRAGLGQLTHREHDQAGEPILYY